MPKREQYFNLDIDNNPFNLSFKAKQYEDLILNVCLLDRGRPFNVDEFSIELYIKKRNSNDDPIKFMANKIVGNDVEIIIPGTDINHSGVFVGEFKITNDEGIFKTPSFYFNVDKSISGTGPATLFTLVDSDGNILLDSENYTLKVTR